MKLLQLSPHMRFEEKTRHAWILFGVVIFLFIVATLLKPESFLKKTNIVSLTSQFPEYGLMAFGMMLCMISGGIDLSQVGAANLSAAVAVILADNIQVDQTVRIVLIVMTCLFAGAACGLINGITIAILRISPMLTTLCTLQIFTGLVMIITKGNALTRIPKTFITTFNGHITNTVPVALVIYGITTAIIAFVLKYTVFGKQLTMMGANPVATRYSGINNTSVTLLTYMTAGSIAGLSGILMSSHYASVKANYGSSYTLLSLLIVVLGGIDPKGGKGKVTGVILSTIALQLMSSIFNIMRFDSHLKTFSWGLLLICVMITNYWPHLSGNSILKREH
jgi:simple sugar transport system permease protein